MYVLLFSMPVKTICHRRGLSLSLYVRRHGRPRLSVCLSVGWLIHREATASHSKLLSLLLLLLLLLLLGIMESCVSFHCTYFD